MELMNSHIHVSIRDKSGRNIFAVTEEEKANGGREGAAFDDTKYISQEAEWFLAGLLEGLSDGMPAFHCPLMWRKLMGSCTDDVPYYQFL
jgi:glutamine synthetase